MGSLSIVYHYGKSVLKGELPKVDACLPHCHLRSEIAVKIVKDAEDVEIRLHGSYCTTTTLHNYHAEEVRKHANVLQ